MANRNSVRHKYASSFPATLQEAEDGDSAINMMEDTVPARVGREREHSMDEGRTKPSLPKLHIRSHSSSESPSSPMLGGTTSCGIAASDVGDGKVSEKSKN